MRPRPLARFLEPGWSITNLEVGGIGEEQILYLSTSDTLVDVTGVVSCGCLTDSSDTADVAFSLIEVSPGLYLTAVLVLTPVPGDKLTLLPTAVAVLATAGGVYTGPYSKEVDP